MPLPVSNQVMLITYADCMGNNLKDLNLVLDTYYKGAFGGLHILPFFPSCADRGFAPNTYREVDGAFGTWDDLTALGQDYFLMYDYMINHLSVKSDIYKDFLQNKEHSKYKDFFILFRNFWPGGDATPQQLDKLYRRQNKPYIEAEFADGTREKLWSTFSESQVDINCQHSIAALEYMRDTLCFLAEQGASVIRLDAFAYATKKADTNCFFIEPNVWDLLKTCRDTLTPYGTIVLPEVHEHYFIQKKLEEKGYCTYDFQLPMLLLNAAFFHKTMYLKNWLRICPRTQFTTLDTHDGIGVTDVRYLMPDEDVLATKRMVFERNPGITEAYVRANDTVSFQKFDTYQINCTFFSALGENEALYFLSRAVQFFTPGIPQVYYVGLFAGKNDFDLYHQTGVRRDINRHYYTLEEIARETERPIVRKLIRLMRLRNEHPAFQGEFHLLDSNESSIRLRWEKDGEYAELYAAFDTAACEIHYSKEGRMVVFP